MPRKASTIRLDPVTQFALENLSRVSKRPMNHLVNEAVKDYVVRRSSDLAQDLEATLASLRAYRLSDPDFEKAIAGFVDAERKIGKDDPVEGQVVIGELVNGQLVEARATGDAGTIHSTLRAILNAA